jgi:5-methylcytosine-specific restriction protein B
MNRWHAAPEVLEAADRWKNRCLINDGSILSDNALWTAENFGYLDKYFLQQLDMGTGDFYQKLEKQLANAPAAAKQLAAEMLWLLFLFIASSGMAGETKRRAIKRVWEWSGEPLPASTDLDNVLDRGVGNPGTAYSAGRWREFAYLVEVMGAWKALAAEERIRLLGDAWTFAGWLDGLASTEGRQLRHILLYLTFPDSFERIATGRDKRAIVKHFLAEFGEDPKSVSYEDRVAVDKAVLRVRERLTAKTGSSVDFYKSDDAKGWRPTGDGGSTIVPLPDVLKKWMAATFGSARIWVVATGEGGRLWEEFRRDGEIAADFGLIGDLEEFRSREDVSSALSDQPQRTAEPMHDSLAAWQLAKEMSVGDFVVAKRGMSALLGYGIVTSDYLFDDSRSAYQHRRKVRWEKNGQWALPESRRVVAKTLTDFTKYADWLRWAWELMASAEKVTPNSSPEPMKFGLEDALQGLFMPGEEFQAILDALGRKKCVILEGPPGVGKTFMARRLAYALMGVEAPERVEMVQFHQSYSYEDFVQGWRPNERGGFVLRDGVFHRFCKRAAAQPDRSFVFIIDEINRGNLSKIFGELLMLIEGDKRGKKFEIQLTYAQSDHERFSVPENVYILGLMNTADRSLALVDYALRRRFSFARLTPAFGSAGFAEHLERAGADESLVQRIVTRMTALNDEIRSDTSALGAGFEIGHSYFVPPAVAEEIGEAWYRSVILSEIEPLLREYWSDQPKKVRSKVEALLA